MAEPVRVPDYRLRKDVLEQWLWYRFNTVIDVYPINTYYVFYLPEGAELTDDERRQLRKLKNKMTFSPPE
ncbi:hypothetical protein B0T10DRAFT_611465 [Thelonectria olida]|uniref:Uncharacterized protein n=1 Tax=Thelonectria olida TaxID=1576542 RepID=A0A9P8VQK4_9HYPO|nr:hypothetical protein B0T10DRAFT_611465 [Thelonectria olida]